MKEFFQKLNNLDFKDLLTKRPLGDKKKSAPDASLLSSLTKIDRTLWGMFAVGAVFLVVGLNILFAHLGLREERDKLEVDLLSLQTETKTLEVSLRQLESKHVDLIDLIREAPPSVDELMAAISEDMAAFGVDLIKSSTSKDPNGSDVIVFSAEGDFQPLREFLKGLSSYSPSFELNLLEVAVVPEKGVLVASLSLVFVRPPRLKTADSSAEYDQRLGPSHRWIKRVQFSPAPPSLAPTPPSKASTASGDSGSQVVPAPQGGPAARNPFLVPPKPAQALEAQPGRGGPSSSSSRSARPLNAATRSDGLVLTGCLWNKDQSSCVFETNDGKIIRARPGDKIVQNMILVSVSEKSVLLRVNDRSINVQIGDQIR